MDPYETLGVPPGASLGQIKQAYRNLAKNFHPDLNPGAEERFKKISQAYKALVAKIQPDPRPSPNPRLVRRDPVVHVGATAPKIARGGVVPTILDEQETCCACNGTGARNGRMIECSACDGTGRIDVISSTMKCPDCAGSGKVAATHCLECLGSGTVLSHRDAEIVLPPGIPAGEEVEVEVLGENERARVIIYLEEGDGFLVSGRSLLKVARISLARALEGGDILVSGPNGDEAELNLPRPCPPGYKTIVPRLGLYGRSLPVRVEVDLPRLDDEALEKVLPILEDQSWSSGGLKSSGC